MAQIKIVAIPPGEAPLWVRQEWVDMTLPVAEGMPSNTVKMGVLSGKPENPESYPVDITVAIQELKKKSTKAAEWWVSHEISKFFRWLDFPKDVCVLTP